MAVSVAIHGAAGRMGRRLLVLAAADTALDLVAAIDRADHPLAGRPVSELEPECASTVMLSSSLSVPAQVMIDFSTPESTVERIAEALERKTALVIGTTGLSPEQEAEVECASREVPVIHAGNYSLGINLLVRVAGEVAKALGESFDIEIAESHHNQKADAPSGTALMIAKGICDSTGRAYPECMQHGRQGRPGARLKGEIGMHALRMGSVVGDHTAFFASPFERIELTHRAETRDVFAAGALRAACWLAGKPAGRYTMNDVLFGS